MSKHEEVFDTRRSFIHLGPVIYVLYCIKPSSVLRKLNTHRRAVV